MVLTTVGFGVVMVSTSVGARQAYLPTLITRRQRAPTLGEHMS